ncbi:MAG TPA: dihydropteroate synthase [Chitinophagaceae bacterium]|nr:dihydropteroate synthase [Chitinophagaceae bacterium]
MFTLNCKGRLLVVDKPIVMGIINITPDSFYTGSRHENIDAVQKQAGKMLSEGATILDIGGQSTRPGSEKVSRETELERVIPAIEGIHKKFPGTFISIDTYYATVAEQAIQAGACIVNDISAGSMDEKMIPTVASLQVPYVLMHMKGTPQTMHNQQHYQSVTKEVLDFLVHKKDELQQAGITDIIIDPGFGFAKNASHNFELLRNLAVFKMLNAPLLLGISRKSFIWKTLRLTADEALQGTIAMNTIGLMNGASILRVHDVKEAVQTVGLWQAMQMA